MKELTIEEKAKAYDKAIEKLRNAFYGNNSRMCEEYRQAVIRIIEPIFPELKKPEDEEIRKGLIENFKWFCGDYPETAKWGKDDNLLVKDIIAWLEKQVSVDEEKVLIGARKDIALSIMNFFNKNTLGMGLSNMECEDLEDAVVNSDWLKVYRYMKKKLEKQVEQKQDPCEHCDNVMLNCQNFPCIKKRAFEQGKSILEVINEEKVEPKYHEGDWVVSPNGVYWHIDRISNNRYEVTSNTGESSNWDLDANIYHKFTIQDAKDGDVLATKDAIFIFKHKDKTGLSLCKSYCEVIGNSKLGFGFDFSINGVYPSTKEQRDTLMKAMADAGYTFDFKRKELKKISQRMISAEAKEAMYGNLTAWSEEDKKRIQRISDFIWKNRKGDTDDIYQQEQDVKWLKSLRLQNQWKPSEEHIHWLKWAINIMPDTEKANEAEAVLEDLLEQLKKLREE